MSSTGETGRPAETGIPDALRPWIGRTQTDREVVSERTARELAATFDCERVPRRGDALPPLWHWALFPETVRQGEIGAEGHAQGAGFLPPAPLPRRMWAGSRIQFHRPLLIGREVTRTARILDIEAKQGRRGPLVLIRVLRELEDAEGSLLREEQDLVFREIARNDAAPAPEAAPTDSTWQRKITPDPVLLFRYSAATFNGHRIHYDRDYTTGREGYPGLLVHGPLVATFMLDLVQRNLPGASIAAFSFRAVAPLFDREPFLVCGRAPAPHGASGPAVHGLSAPEVKVWAQNSAGHLCAHGAVTLSAPTRPHTTVGQAGDASW